MTTIENTTRLVGIIDKISKHFASIENIDCDISISKTELLTLESIFEQKEFTMSKLAQKLGISYSAATVNIDHLVEKKLVIRGNKNGDRRVVTVFLSDKGKEIASTYREQKKVSYKKMLDVLTEKEQQSFVIILEKIANMMK